MKTPSWRQILQEAAAATNLDALLAIIVHRVKNSLAVDVCSIFLTDHKNDQFILAASAGSTVGEIGKIRMDRHEGLLGLVGERLELVVLNNATIHPLYRVSPELGAERYDHFLGMPLVHNRQLLGILVIWKKVHDHSKEMGEAYSVTLAPQLAKAIYEVSTVGEVIQMLGAERKEQAFIQGVQAAAGLTIGTAVVLPSLAKLESTPDRQVQDVEAEETAFMAAIVSVQKELSSSQERLSASLPEEVRALFDVYALLLKSERLVSGTIGLIRAGNWAPGAWRNTIANYAQVFEKMEDPYMRARAEDIREVGQRVLLRLGAHTQESRPWPEHCILVGDTVSITEIAEVPVGRLAGIVCRHGSALSHTAVLAKALGIPAVVNLGTLPGIAIDNHLMAVDGYHGRIYIEPSPTVLNSIRNRIDEEKTRTDKLTTLCHLPAETLDGIRLPLYANITLASDTAAAQDCGAEGIGLYRTEYLFLLRESFPTENEQYAIYRETLEAFAPKTVVLRTLDVGGDKILRYFPIDEGNPFLGCRGIRFSLEHPEIFLLQLRAMLRANAGLGNLSVLFPMISQVAELDEASALLARAYQELLEEGQTVQMPRVGVMIEVPSAVYLARTLAKRVDFMTVGTNDLTQYILAADRNNAQVAAPDDGFHPAVLDAIQRAIQGGHLEGIPVGVCGEIAGESTGALLLLGMEVDRLSMSSASLPQVKQTIRSITRQRARELLDTALGMENGPDVRRLLNDALEEVGVGGL